MSVKPLRRALYLVSHHPLDVRLVSNRKVPIEINSLIREFESKQPDASALRRCPTPAIGEKQVSPDPGVSE
ncbi:hypothetical protein CY708_20415 [Salmonella enterica]|nr:hypothetical protein [Salmonella enterica]